VDKPFSGLLFHAILLLLSSCLALLTEESLFGNTVERWEEAVYVEALVTLIANDQFNIVIIEVFFTDFASHVLKALVPLFSSDVGGAKTEIAFTTLGPAQALGKRSAVDVKLIVKGQFFVFLDVLQSKDADTDLTQYIPLLSNTVGLARMVDESCEVALVGRVDDLALRCFHEVGAGRLAVFLHSGLPEVRVGRKDLPDVLHDERPPR
jgi:hypothetical protein